MANTDWTDAHRRAACAAIAALANTIGLLKEDGARVGTVSGTTTWGTPADHTDGGIVWARSLGSTVALTIPAGTLNNGDTITHYGIYSGSTLLRKRALPFAMVVSDAAQQGLVDVTPQLWFRGD